jgi:hypothetical protein
MIRSDLPELQFITMISNVPSIMEHGILSHQLVSQFWHASIAMAEIQARRATKRVPGGRPLHEYANLYLCARNPMLYKRKEAHQELCVLRVSTEVLDLPGVIIADGNAASDYTAFWPSPAGLSRVDKDLVFAEYWTDEDQIRAWQKGRVKCAEVLVPDRVAPHLVLGAYASCDAARRTLETTVPRLPTTVDAHLFFR